MLLPGIYKTHKSGTTLNIFTPKNNWKFDSSSPWEKSIIINWFCLLVVVFNQVNHCKIFFHQKKIRNIKIAHASIHSRQWKRNYWLSSCIKKGNIGHEGKSWCVWIGIKVQHTHAYMQNTLMVMMVRLIVIKGEKWMGF